MNHTDPHPHTVPQGLAPHPETPTLSAGWWRVTLHGASRQHPFWPTVAWIDAQGDHRRIDLPFVTEHRSSTCFRLPKGAQVTGFWLSPWPMTTTSDTRIQFSRVSRLAILGHRLRTLAGLLLRREVWRMVWQRVVAQGIPLGPLLAALVRILRESGLAGLHTRLAKPFASGADRQVVSDYWWYRRYLASLPSGTEQEGGPHLPDHLIVRHPQARLLPGAVAQLAAAARQAPADLIHGDAFTATGPQTGHLRLHARFSLDRFLFHPDLGEVIAIRKTIARKMGVDETTPLSLPLLCQLFPHCRTITHVSALLASGLPRRLDPQTAATLVGDMLSRAAPPSPRQILPGPAGLDVRWPLAPGTRVAVIIPTCNQAELLQRCINSIKRTCDPSRYRLIVIDHQSDAPDAVAYLQRLAETHTVHRLTGAFNFSRFNNIASSLVPESDAFLAFLNNDVEAVTEGWLERLLELAARPDVGIAGPLLQYPDGRVQHAGLVLGLWHLCDHLAKFQPLCTDQGELLPGRDDCVVRRSEVSALTGACMVMRKAVFDRVGGFDERLAVGFNDVDLCLRVAETGLKIVYDGQTRLMHHESASRGKSLGDPHPEDTRLFMERHGHRIRQPHPDPFFSPYLSRQHLDPLPDPQRATPPHPPVFHTSSIWHNNEGSPNVTDRLTTAPDPVPVHHGRKSVP